jgi:predicted anti-sigma-YlaC factor YlaD
MNMTCDQIKSILAERFDRNELTTLSIELKTHIKDCTNCQNYYTKLHTLDEGIGELTNYPLNETILEEELKKIKLPQNFSLKDRSFFKKWQVAAAVIIMAFMGLFSQLFFDFSPPTQSQPMSAFYLHSAQVEKRSARTVIFQSAEDGKPSIVWLY